MLSDESDDRMLSDPPWVVEIDGIKFATPEAVVLLLKAVSEERDALREALERLQDHHCSGLCDSVPEEDHMTVMNMVNEALDA